MFVKYKGWDVTWKVNGLYYSEKVFFHLIIIDYHACNLYVSLGEIIISMFYFQY